MILFHLQTPGQAMTGTTLFSGLPAVFHHAVGLTCFREGGWYAV